MVNDLNTALLGIRKKLDELEIPFCLVCGTLLGLHRNGCLIDYDKDIDVAVFASDITPDKLAQMKKENANFSHMEDSGIPGEITYFFNDIHADIFPIFFKNGKAFFHLESKCLWWPEDVLKNWRTTRYLDLDWNVPKDTRKFIVHYFGKDWKTPIKDFAWTNAPNACDYEKI